MDDLTRILTIHAVSDRLKNHAHPPVEGRQMGFPENGGHWVLGHAFSQCLAQGDWSVVKSRKEKEEEKRGRVKRERGRPRRVEVEKAECLFG